MTLFTLLLSATLGHAQNQSFMVPNYDCQLIVVTSDDSRSFQKKFQADYYSGSHGGRDFTFENGTEKVILQASNNWMSLNWFSGDQLLAAGLSASSEPTMGSRALIVVNPLNSEEQVSLDCTPESE